MSDLAGLPPRDRRLLLGLVSQRLRASRGPEVRAALARSLLAEVSAGGDEWPSGAMDLLIEASGMPGSIVWQSIATVAREHESTYGLTTPIDVARAALAHLDDWPALDPAGRAAAIEDELLNRFQRATNAVIDAANRHGLPVAAPELHPPLTTGYGYTDEILRMLVHGGMLVATGERRNGWAVYTTPSPFLQTDDAPKS